MTPKRDPRLLAAALVTGAALWLVAGCAHRESQRSRDILYCVRDAQYGPGLTPAQRNAAVERCGK